MPKRMLKYYRLLWCISPSWKVLRLQSHLSRQCELSARHSASAAQPLQFWSAHLLQQQTIMTEFHGQNEMDRMSKNSCGRLSFRWLKHDLTGIIKLLIEHRACCYTFLMRFLSKLRNLMCIQKVPCWCMAGPSSALWHILECEAWHCIAAIQSQLQSLLASSGLISLIELSQADSCSALMTTAAKSI